MSGRSTPGLTLISDVPALFILRAHLDTGPGSLSPSDGERVGEREFELATLGPPLPGPLLHLMEEREKMGAVRGCALILASG